jgi:type IV pilus assembly protein PilV
MSVMRIDIQPTVIKRLALQPTCIKNSSAHQLGESLVEVIITVIIISIGLLGTASLQIRTLKNLSSSHSISLAAMVAEDFGDRLRANKAGANWYIHNSFPTHTSADCANTNCNPEQLAAYDIRTWWEQVQKGLPTGSIEVTNPGTNNYQITVRWDENRSGKTGTNCPRITTNDLDCQRLNVTLI